MFTDCYLNRTVLTRLFMQSHNRVEIEGFDKRVI